MTDQDKVNELVRQRLVEMIKPRLSCLPLAQLAEIAFEADVITASEMHMILKDTVPPKMELVRCDENAL